MSSPVQHVDLVVGGHDVARSQSVLAHERVEGLLEDRAGAFGHHRDSRRHRHRVLVERVASARSAMFVGQVADALQLAVDLDDGDEEAQVAGDGLVQRQDLEALLLDLDLVLVYQDVGRRSPCGPSSASRCSMAWNARRRLSSTSAPSARILRFSRSISRLQMPHRTLPVSAEAAGDVFLGLLLRRVREDLRGRPELDDAALEEEGRVVAHARRLLHVVRDEHDRVVALELEDELLDLRRGRPGRWRSTARP